MGARWYESLCHHFTWHLTALHFINDIKKVEILKFRFYLFTSGFELIGNGVYNNSIPRHGCLDDWLFLTSISLSYLISNCRAATSHHSRSLRRFFFIGRLLFCFSKSLLLVLALENLFNNHIKEWNTTVVCLWNQQTGKLRQLLHSCKNGMLDYKSKAHF